MSKGINGYYQVSNLGRIKRLKTFHRTNKVYSSIGYYRDERIVKQYLSEKGYFKCQFYKENKRKTVYVHRIVARSIYFK